MENQMRISDAVEFICRDILEFNIEDAKATCDMEWKYEWQRKLMIYRIFLHMADMVWKTYKDVSKKGI